MLSETRQLELRAIVAREQALACIRAPHSARFDFWWRAWSQAVADLAARRFAERNWGA